MGVLTAVEPHDVSIEAKGLVKPRRSIAAVQIKTPSSMYGLRRPNLDFELSASTPV